jgi:hypothetical protein
VCVFTYAFIVLYTDIYDSWMSFSSSFHPSYHPHDQNHCILIFIYICTNIYIHIHIYIIYILPLIPLSACAPTSIYVCMYIYTYIHTYVYIYNLHIASNPFECLCTHLHRLEGLYVNHRRLQSTDL